MDSGKRETIKDTMKTFFLFLCVCEKKREAINKLQLVDWKVLFFNFNCIFKKKL